MRRLTAKGKIEFLTGYTRSTTETRDGNHMRLDLMCDDPYAAGKGIRGAWRHCAMCAIVKNLWPTKLTHSDIEHMLGVDILSKGEVQNFDALKLVNLREKHPFFGMFGEFLPAHITGRLQINNAIAHGIKPVTYHGQRSDPVQRRRITRDMVSDPEAFDEHIADLEEQRKKRKSKEAVEQATNMPYSFEMIPPCTINDHYFVIGRPTPEMLDIFGMALKLFSEEPYLGAQVGMNLGLCKMTYDIAIDGEKLGELSLGGYEYNIDLGPLKRFEGAASKFITPENFRKPDFRKPE